MRQYPSGDGAVLIKQLRLVRLQLAVFTTSNMRGKEMKGVVAEYPYNDYYLYVIYHKKEGRRYAVLVPIDKTKNIKRTTISYARYLMSVKEKRFLNKDEDVDHIDEDKTNDDINNLQILSKKDNIVKGNKRNGVQMVELKCPNCGMIFHKRKGKTHLTKNRGNYTACSRKCASAFGALKQYHPNSDFVINGLKDNVIKEYISFD